MFDYSDPTGTGTLQREGALQNYRTFVHAQYDKFAKQPNSAFVYLDAFDGLQSSLSSVKWSAFPRNANASDATIDANRDRLQDEYVEWNVERDGNGNVSKIEFVTEFTEFWQSLATISSNALIAGVQDCIAGANPTMEELFGPNFDPSQATPLTRAIRFTRQLPNNPWQNGAKGMLCLAQRANTMGALFNLIADCAELLPGPSSDACDLAAPGACEPNRNSDPKVCSAAQEARKTNKVISLADPCGIKIDDLGGNWKIDGHQIDINKEHLNGGAWSIIRNRHRAILNVVPGLTLNDDPIISGAQVAKVLNVMSTVIVIEEDKVDPMFKTGQESTRATP